MNSRRLLSARRRASGGFTLVEIIITMSVFILLAAAVFALLGGILQGANTLQDNQSRRDQVVAFESFLRGRLQRLNSQSTFLDFRRGIHTEAERQGVVFDIDGEAVAFDVDPQANGLYTLRFARYQPPSARNTQPPAVQLNEAIAHDDPAIAWQPLIHDVRTLNWKFRDLNAIDWVDDWQNAGTRPTLVEVSLELAGDQRPTIIDLWIPRISNGEPATPGGG